MNHNSAFINLVDDAKTRVREISAEEVLSTLSLRERGGISQSEGSYICNAYNKTGPHPSPLPEGEGMLLIDVREESEFAAGRIPGAMHLSKGIIECYIEGKVPDKATPMVLYCGGGYRSALAADALQKMGYSNVYSMAGGWRGWNERGFPTQ